MSKVIKVKRTEVEVTEEVYEEYYKSRRRARYYESDVKVGRIEVNDDSESVIFHDAKEVSFDCLTDAGHEFAGTESIEDQIIKSETSMLLKAALTSLSDADRELIQLIYTDEKTTREIAVILGISQTSVIKRHASVLKKLQKILKK